MNLNKIEQQRKEKILRTQSHTARVRSLTAGILLYNAVCDYLGIEVGESNPRPLNVSYEKEGKPYLVEYPDVFFNLSHSGDLVCCAISNYQVGIDVQKHGIVKEGIAQRFFTQQDNQMLAACEEAKREELFFRMWSVKESFIKYTGEGMRRGFDTFSIDWEKGEIFEGRDVVTNSISERIPAACFVESDFVEKYSISLCFGEKNTKIEWIKDEE